VPIFEPLFLELQSFVGCIMEGTPTPVPASDGLRALRLVMDIREATREHLVDAAGGAQSIRPDIVESALAPAQD
jgi:hypothetical protein